MIMILDFESMFFLTAGAVLPCLLHFVMPLPSAGTIPRQHKPIHVQGVLVLSVRVLSLESGTESDGSKSWFGWKLIALSISLHPNQFCEVANHMTEFMPDFKCA